MQKVCVPLGWCARWVWSVCGGTQPAAAQQGATGGEWRGYGGEPWSTK